MTANATTDGEIPPSPKHAIHIDGRRTVLGYLLGSQTQKKHIRVIASNIYLYIYIYVLLIGRPRATIDDETIASLKCLHSDIRNTGCVCTEISQNSRHNIHTRSGYNKLGSAHSERFLCDYYYYS